MSPSPSLTLPRKGKGNFIAPSGDSLFTRHGSGCPGWLGIVMRAGVFVLSGLITLLLLSSDSLANPKRSYHDIYLMENRVCKSCHWEWADRSHIRLINRAGHAALVSPDEIIGINRHPVMRFLTLHSLAGIGQPGPIIAPEAYENGNDYVCKYCDMIKK